MHPFSVLWVVLLFLGIHQIEGHIGVPKVMGSVLRLHPLLVIFGLLAGANVDGSLGALVVAPPLLSVGRASFEFFAERIVLEPWFQGGGDDPRRGRAGRRAVPQGEPHRGGPRSPPVSMILHGRCEVDIVEHCNPPAVPAATSPW